MSKKLKVVVLFGGESTEREISIASGTQVIASLRRSGFDVIALDPAVGILDELAEKEYFAGKVSKEPPAPGAFSGARILSNILTAGKLDDVDLYFIALHGGYGENGSIQAVLEMNGLKYTGSSVLGSAVAMNKDVSKRLFVESGVRTPPWLMDPSSKEEVQRIIGYPLVVKPCSQGSTVGLSIVRQESELEAALELARKYDEEVMIEKFIPGRELTVGVVGDSAYSVGEIVLGKSGIFDFESKYQGGTVEIFPAKVSEDVTIRAQELALKAHKALKLSDYSRADFRLDSSNTLWCLEVNTLPGMTSTSLLPQSAAASKVSFDELCQKICDLALR